MLNSYLRKLTETETILGEIAANKLTNERQTDALVDNLQIKLFALKDLKETLFVYQKIDHIKLDAPRIEGLEELFKLGSSLPTSSNLSKYLTMCVKEYSNNLTAKFSNEYKVSLQNISWPSSFDVNHSFKENEFQTFKTSFNHLLHLQLLYPFYMKKTAYFFNTP